MGTDLLPLMRYLFEINVPLRGGVLLWYYSKLLKYMS